MNDSARVVLFLCTGNYYRSRFAEILFNARAVGADIPWRAESRGLELSDLNEGPISPHTLEGLRAREIPVPEPYRDPLSATEADLRASEVIVAVKECEHRPFLESQFKSWVEQVEFWQIDDAYDTSPVEALVSLEKEVEQLLLRLQQ